MLFRDLQAERVWRDVADWSLAVPRRWRLCGAVGLGWKGESPSKKLLNRLSRL
jgi:hypothetical protein